MVINRVVVNGQRHSVVVVAQHPWDQKHSTHSDFRVIDRRDEEGVFK